MNVFDFDSLDDTAYDQYACKGCDHKILIVTDLPWRAIDHTTWQHLDTTDNKNRYISNNSCFDALAAAAGAQALAQKYNRYFYHTDYIPERLQ